MKILHYAVFYASGSVRNFLYSKEIDPMTIHLNDYKFMEKIMFIFVSTLFYLKDFQTNIMGLKPRINIQQFFKYGYAEQKMMMCVDTITRVKEMAKEIRINSSLSSSRKMTLRQSSQSGERMS